MKTPFSKNNLFQTYYTKEIEYLRKAGANFAKEHPKAAKHLDLGQSESLNPQTERLIESFAFFSAKINQRIDQVSDDLCAHLLEILAPDLLTPFPSMAIAQFKPDSKDNRILKQQTIPKGTLVYGTAPEGVDCTFQTVYPISLAPFTILNVDVITGDLIDQSATKCYLKIKMKPIIETPWKQLHMDHLMFHLQGQQNIAFAIYEQLFNQKNPEILVEGRTDTLKIHKKFLQDNSLKPLGFSENQTILPNTHPSYPGTHQLLREFFQFKEKFLFFEIHHLNSFFSNNNHEFDDDDLLTEISLYIRLKNQKGMPSTLGPENFILNCTPIVNLFQKISDPLRLDYRKNEYPLLIDQRRTQHYALHTILDVFKAQGTSENITSIPYYFSHRFNEQQSTLFWYRKKVFDVKSQDDPQDVFLSFVNLAFDPKNSPSDVIYAKTLCTNGRFASTIPGQTTLWSDETFFVSSIELLAPPTPYFNQNATPHFHRRLLSLFSSNPYLQFQDPQYLESLKMYWILLSETTGSSHLHLPMIEALSSLSKRSVTRRMGKDVWRGFIEGHEIHLTSTHLPNTGSPHFLFSILLSKFFNDSILDETFIDFVLHSQEEDNVWIECRHLFQK